MSTRFAWIFGFLALVSIGFLIACGSHYSSSSDGLLLIPSQGSTVIQTFSFNLSSGRAAAINKPPVAPGVPSSIILDPTGSFAYVIVANNSIAAYKVNSDGTLTSAGTPTTGSKLAPVALAMDSAGKYLFVANGIGASISVLSIGSGGALTLVGSTSLLAQPPVPPNFVALAVTPTVFPSQNASCSSRTPQSAEYLYVADSANDTVWEFSINPSSGALGNPPNFTSIPGFTTGSVPSGVAVDACNRFVFVANQNSNDVNGFTMCNGTVTQSSTCPSIPDGSLVSVGAAMGAGNGPAALAVDPLGNYLYVVNKLAGSVSSYRISQATGTLTSLSTTATGSTPVAIAIRGDDNWVFVSDYASASVSQYALTPGSGAITPQAPITTDNYPWGVAVK